MINFSSKENMLNLIELERVSLMSNLDIQKNLNRQILIFMKNFMSNIKISFDVSPEIETFTYLNESTLNLNKSNSNINELNLLLNILNKINTSSNENLESELKNYNNKFKEIMNTVYKNTEIIEKFVFKITTTDISNLSDISKMSDTPELIFVSENIEESSDAVTTDVSKTVVSNNTTNNAFVENTLIISDTLKKVILPYELKTVKEIFKNSKKYKSIEDVINKVYTKPLSYYRFSPISRFKEAFKLIKEREKGSTFKALSLAFELLGNYTLHPAIISSCKTLDELDIYLACLDDNTLEDFHFFDIKYEIPLALAKLTTASNLRISKLANL